MLFSNASTQMSETDRNVFSDDIHSTGGGALKRGHVLWNYTQGLRNCCGRCSAQRKVIGYYSSINEANISTLRRLVKPQARCLSREVIRL